MRPAHRLALLLAAAIPAAGASADVLYYSNTFETNVLETGWGPTAKIENGLGAFSKYVGRYSENTPTILNNSVSLTLPRATDDLGEPTGETTLYTLTFDFYAIDRWRGNDAALGPDKFEVFINTVNRFSYTFSNTGSGQTFRAPDVGPSLLGYNPADKDSIYRNISIPFDIGSAPTMVIKWRSDGLTGLSNESWGIDNVRISYVVTPSPGSLALLGLGGVFAGLRPRRR